MLFVLLLFAILGIRLFYLQIIRGDYYNKLAKNNCLRKIRINPLRGLIYDQNGNLLVDNRPSFDLGIIPKDAEPLDATAQKLSKFIPLSKPEILSRIRKFRDPFGYNTVLLQKDIGRDLMGRLLAREYELPGIVIVTSASRDYLYDQLAAHLIGYLGEITLPEIKSGRYPNKRPGDLVGRYGIEKTFERQLSGKPGTRLVEVNATGQIMKQLGVDPPVPGDNLYLTIDLRLQQTAENLLKGLTGAVVAMDPKNGDVLAMASSPSYDQNAFINGMSSAQWRALITNPDRPMRNKAIQAQYPPGSTYKIVTAMAALGEGIINKNSKEFCPGYLKYGNRIYHCWKRTGHGQVNVVEALEQSCDVFFYHMGIQLGVDKLAWYARACGFGARTGIALSHEAPGLVPTAEWKKRISGHPWQAGENLSIAIGQGADLVTPLQMAVLLSAVANGGTEYRPRVVKLIRTPAGETVQGDQPEIMGKLPASRQIIDIIKKGLYDVVNNRNGTAYWSVRSNEVDISGKTGTAQVVASREEHEATGKLKKSLLPHAWFVGYAPSDKPTIAVSVIIEHGSHGASSAGPIAKKLILSYLGKEKAPDKPNE